MEKISREDLINQVGSIYKLCNLAAMRAMELNNGFEQLVEGDLKEKGTSIAIREISEGKVRIKKV